MSNCFPELQGQHSRVGKLSEAALTTDCIHLSCDLLLIIVFIG